MPNETAFTASELALFKRFAGLMIPPAPGPGLPGADDSEILDQLTAKLATRAMRVRAALHQHLPDDIGMLANLPDAPFKQWYTGWVEGWPAQPQSFLSRFVPSLLQAYYEDVRVQQAYDRRPGPPFPEGYAVIQGDWSLLDNVRKREPLYRE